jgi:mono/diheme cytochrome c family protein
MNKKWLQIGGVIVAIGMVLFLVIQVLPLGAQKTNPAVIAEPKWDTPRTRELAKRACFDCHSNETQWPWYSYVAPVSWLVTNDVKEGRATFNFSDWHAGDMQGSYMAQIIAAGRMPLPPYLLMHPEAQLSAADKQALIDGLKATAP